MTIGCDVNVKPSVMTVTVAHVEIVLALKFSLPLRINMFYIIKCVIFSANQTALNAFGAAYSAPPERDRERERERERESGWKVEEWKGKEQEI